MQPSHVLAFVGSPDMVVEALRGLGFGSAQVSNQPEASVKLSVCETQTAEPNTLAFRGGSFGRSRVCPNPDWPLNHTEKVSYAMRLYERELEAGNALLSSKDDALQTAYGILARAAGQDRVSGIAAGQVELGGGSTCQ